jgi:hypothetical protein
VINQAGADNRKIRNCVCIILLAVAAVAGLDARPAAAAGSKQTIMPE